MKWFLVLLVLFWAMIFAGYGLYLVLRLWERHKGIHVADRKSIFCYYGLHSWRTDCSWFSSAQRCRNCGKAEDEQEMRCLELERRFWTEVQETEGISFEDAEKQVTARLSAWSGKTAAELLRSASWEE